MYAAVGETATALTYEGVSSLKKDSASQLLSRQLQRANLVELVGIGIRGVHDLNETLAGGDCECGWTVREAIDEGRSTREWNWRQRL